MIVKEALRSFMIAHKFKGLRYKDKKNQCACSVDDLFTCGTWQREMTDIEDCELVKEAKP